MQGKSKYIHKIHAGLPNIINSNTAMAYCFNNYICQKILNIHDGFSSSTLSRDVPLIQYVHDGWI